MKFLLCLFFLLASVSCMPYYAPLQGEAGGLRTLVIMDNLDLLPSFSLFFEDLSARGHALTFYQSEAAELTLKRYGEMLYDNIVFFAPGAESFSSLSFEDLTDFVRDGGNLLLAANKKVSDNVRGMAESFGISIDKKDTEVIDHFESFDELDVSRQHIVVQAKNAMTSNVVLGDFNDKISSQPVLFRGVGHKLGKDNILAIRILRGNPTTYSYFASKAITDAPENAGSATSLVSGLQGRNNARVLFSGSLDLFSNAYFAASPNGSPSGNRPFAYEVSKWAFRESGVLRFRNIVHHKSDGTPPDVILHEKPRPDLPTSLFPDPEITRNSLVYRIKDEIVYSMVVEEYSNGKWIPFSADDMQLEFVMLDPYVRKTMTSDPQTGKFLATFTAPDSYGVFKFRVFYRRSGYSVLHAETQVSIRPFKHNEYERFIFSAFPYYSSAFSAVVAFFVFAISFLFTSD